MIQVFVHLYGALRDYLPPNGKGAVNLPLDATIQDLLATLALEQNSPSVQARPILLAVNDETEVSPEYPLKDGDRVTIVTAITGGALDL